MTLFHWNTAKFSTLATSKSSLGIKKQISLIIIPSTQFHMLFLNNPLFRQSKIFPKKSPPELYIQSGTFYTDWSTSINIKLKSHQLFWILRFIYPPLEPLIRLGKTIRAASFQDLTRCPLCKWSLSSFQTPLNIPSIPA